MTGETALKVLFVASVIGLVIYMYSKEQITIDNYKDHTEGKNNIVRPGGSMKGSTKVYQIWNGAYTPVDPLTRSL